MGQGATIQELAERDSDFRNYLVQIRRELEVDQVNDLKALEQKIENYYSRADWSYKPIMELDALEVQQVSVWSLDNVTNILGGIRDAIFGDSAPPAGTKIEKPADFGLALEKMNDLNLLAVNKAFVLIQSILETFATESSYQGKVLMKSDMVAPGMMIFVSIRSDIWRNKDFFNNDSIAQYLYTVRSFYSAEQAGDIAKFNSVLAYSELASGFDRRIEEIARKVADPETPYSALTELMQVMGFLSEQLSSIHAKIAELQAQKSTKVIADSQQAVIARQKAQK